MDSEQKVEELEQRVSELKTLVEELVDNHGKERERKMKIGEKKFGGLLSEET